MKQLGVSLFIGGVVLALGGVLLGLLQAPDYETGVYTAGSTQMAFTNPAYNQIPIALLVLGVALISAASYAMASASSVSQRPLPARHALPAEPSAAPSGLSAP